MQDVCDNQDKPGCSSTLCMGSEEEVDEVEVPALEKKVRTGGRVRRYAHPTQKVCSKSLHNTYV